MPTLGVGVGVGVGVGGWRTRMAWIMVVVVEGGCVDGWVAWVDEWGRARGEGTR